MILLESAELGYGDKCILSDVQLTLNKGDVIILEGPNGSGKTTLARTLLSVIPLLKGSMQNQFKRMAYVPQKSFLDEQYPLMIRSLVAGGLPRKKRFQFSNKLSVDNQKKVQNAMSATGVSKISHLPIREASGGQLQRALISRALVSDPDFLLLDEPFSNLDRKGKEVIISLLNHINKSHNVSLFIIDHAGHLPIAGARKLVIEEGKLGG